ncbi:MAG TPA: dihydrofolate reductase family protein [Parvularculaceae bacterium]|nr:dihydrofolate reductase family protein [Parvularculaceae bacterium]
MAASLDGFIAGPNGEYDWIMPDPAVDFMELYKEFDTALMGRLTFELAESGPGARLPGMQTIVCSRTLRSADFPKFTITPDAVAAVAALKSESGKDIWLFGGGALFRSLLDAGLADTVEVEVMPVLLGQGAPLLPGGARPYGLQLSHCKAKPNGIVSLSYIATRV